MKPPLRIEPERVSQTALQFYRREWSRIGRESADESRMHLARLEQEAAEVDVPQAALDEIYERERKKVRFLCQGDPYEWTCQEPVLVSTPFGIAAVFTPVYWRRHVMARHYAPDYYIRGHAVEQYRNRFGTDDTTIVDVARALEDVRPWPGLQGGKSHWQGVRVEYHSSADPRGGHSFPVFVVAPRQRPHEQDIVVTTLTAAQVSGTEIYLQGGAKSPLLIPDDVLEAARRHCVTGRPDEVEEDDIEDGGGEEVEPDELEPHDEQRHGSAPAGEGTAPEEKAPASQALVRILVEVTAADAAQLLTEVIRRGYGTVGDDLTTVQVTRSGETNAVDQHAAGAGTAGE